MKILKLFLFVVLSMLITSLLVTSFALATNVNDYDQLTLQETITGGASIQKISDSFRIDLFSIDLLLYPRTSNNLQIVNEEYFPTNLNIENIEDVKRFIWKKPSNNNLDFRYTTLLKSNVIPLNLKEKISYPLENVPLEYQEYLEFTGSIDTNSELSKRAKEFAASEDDLFMLEYKLARFVESHVKYDLNSNTRDSNKASTWVYENQVGACDEFTNLFISMNRAIGIPARFVSGVAYSDSPLFDVKWGNHGWAEVYFPEHGWIPFDTTYKQYGSVDATHIAFRREVDGVKPSVTFKGRGLGYSFDSKDLKFNTEVVAMGNLVKDKTIQNIEIQETEVGFGSYNLAVVTVKNPYETYVVDTVQLAQTNDLEILGDLYQMVALEPLSQKKIYYLIKVKDDLKNNYQYEFPITIFTQSDIEITKSFFVNRKFQKYSQDYMEQFVRGIEEDEYLLYFTMNCDFAADIYLEDNKSIECTLNLNEGFELKSNEIELCYENICQEYNIVNGITDFKLNLNSAMLGVNTITVNSHHSNGDEKYFYTYTVYDETYFSIKDINMESRLEYIDKIPLVFFFRKESHSPANNVTIFLEHDNFQEKWQFEKLESDKEFNIVVAGNILTKGSNDIVIGASYFTNKGELVELRKNVQIDLVNVSLEQNAILHMNAIGNRVSKISNKFADNFLSDNASDSSKKMLRTVVLLLFIFVLFIVIKIISDIILRFTGLKKKHDEIDEIIEGNN